LSQQPVDYDADIVGQMGVANGRFFFDLLQIGSHQPLNKPAASAWNVVNQRRRAALLLPLIFSIAPRRRRCSFFKLDYLSEQVILTVPCDPISHCPYIINMNPHYELEF
jgi:hypothetical protein